MAAGAILLTHPGDQVGTHAMKYFYGPMFC